MSTYLYLQCMDHDPPLQSQDESGQHFYDLPQICRLIIVDEYGVEYPLTVPLDPRPATRLGHVGADG